MTGCAHAGGHQWSLAHGNEPSTILRVHGDVAVMVSGALGLRPEPSDARAFRKHVVRPLLSISDGSVSIFVCLDSDRRTQAGSLHPSRFAREAARWNETRGVFRDASTNQFDRLQACYERTLPEQFALYVRARPDSLWYAPLVVQTLDAVTLRGRILFVPSDVVHVPEQALSWRCSVHRGPLRCSLVDDQYALVPSRFREAYFLGKCEAPQSRCPAGARTRAVAIELAREDRSVTTGSPGGPAVLSRDAGERHHRSAERVPRSGAHCILTAVSALRSDARKAALGQLHAGRALHGSRQPERGS